MLSNLNLLDKSKGLELEQRVHAEISRLLPFLDKLPSIPVIAGVSGGSDSLALAFMLHSYGLNLTVCIVDHSLRDESAEEAQFTLSLLNSHGINGKIITLDSTQFPKGAGVQERARLARLDALENYAFEIGSPVVFLGHQHDDLLETVAFRQEKDSFPAGLKGIVSSSIYKRVALLRPMLDCSREELKEFLREKDIRWVSDPTNQNRKYARVRIRQDLTTERARELIVIQKQANKDHESSELQMLKLCPKYVEWQSWGGFKVDSYIQEILKHKEQVFFFRKLIGFLSNRHPPSFDSVERLLKKEEGTLGGVRFKKRKEYFFISRELRQEPVSIGGLFDGRWRYVGEQKGYEVGYLGKDISKLNRDRDVPAFCLQTLPVLRYQGVLVALSSAYLGKHPFAKADFVWNGKPPLFV